MPTPTKGPRLGGSPAHERAILANLATDLFENGRITTTQAKAKRLRPLAEKLITFAKRGDLHARRQVLTVVRDQGVVHHLFAELGPRFLGRPGGYTRIVKLGPRKGDNAPMAIIELVEAMDEVAKDDAASRSGRLSKVRKAQKDESVAALAGEDDTPEVPASADEVDSDADAEKDAAQADDGADKNDADADKK